MIAAITEYNCILKTVVCSILKCDLKGLRSIFAFSSLQVELDFWKYSLNTVYVIKELCLCEMHSTFQQHINFKIIVLL